MKRPRPSNHTLTCYHSLQLFLHNSFWQSIEFENFTIFSVSTCDLQLTVEHAYQISVSHYITSSKDACLERAYLSVPHVETMIFCAQENLCGLDVEPNRTTSLKPLSVKTCSLHAENISSCGDLKQTIVSAGEFSEWSCWRFCFMLLENGYNFYRVFLQLSETFMHIFSYIPYCISRNVNCFKIIYQIALKGQKLTASQNRIDLQVSIRVNSVFTSWRELIKSIVVSKRSDTSHAKNCNLASSLACYLRSNATRSCRQSRRKSFWFFVQ